MYNDRGKIVIKLKHQYFKKQLLFSSIITLPLFTFLSLLIYSIILKIFLPSKITWENKDFLGLITIIIVYFITAMFLRKDMQKYQLKIYEKGIQSKISYTKNKYTEKFIFFNIPCCS